MSLHVATAAWQRGDWTSAATACETHLSKAPDDADALHLLGLCQLKIGQAQSALDLLARAFTRRPGDPQIGQNLGLALLQNKQPLAAAQAWSQIAKPNLALRYQLANAWLAAEQDQQAIEVLEQVLQQHPEQTRASSKLALLFDERNEPERAIAHARQALDLSPADYRATLVLARQDQRAGRLDQALERVDRLLEFAESPVNQAVALGLKARLHDRLAQFTQAFAAAGEANELLAQTADYQAARNTSVYSLQVIEELNQFLDPARLENWGSEPLVDSAGQVQPVFLVGFPRSGTTLLDKLLSAHPGVQVIEEQPLLHDTLTWFVGDSSALERSERLTQNDAVALQVAYRKRIHEHLGSEPTGLVIDKLPLNLIFIALIWRVFPQAKFLFALRDPRDVVLSCWFQTFGANDAMSHFLNLDEAANYYSQAMGLARRCVDQLPLASMDVRYESLVNDLAGCAREIIAFLDLPWVPEILDFREKLAGQRISTPSFDQVSQPIYARSAGRWRNYQTQLAPILPVLEPMVRQLGYTFTDAGDTKQ